MIFIPIGGFQAPVKPPPYVHHMNFDLSKTREDKPKLIEQLKLLFPHREKNIYDNII